MTGKQPLLALAPVRQPRRRREHVGFHAAVLALRRKGWTVYRGGAEHAMVNGERWPASRLLRAAKGVGE